MNLYKLIKHQFPYTYQDSKKKLFIFTVPVLFCKCTKRKCRVICYQGYTCNLIDMCCYNCKVGELI